MKRAFLFFGLLIALSLQGMRRDAEQNVSSRQNRTRRDWINTIPPYVGPLGAIGHLGYGLIKLWSSQR